MQHWFTYPNIDPIAIHLGRFNVHWYGIAYLVAFVLVYLWMSRPEGRRRLGLTRFLAATAPRPPAATR